MNIIGICAADWYKTSRAIIGKTPFTYPPRGSRRHPIENVLSEATESDVFFLNLHGFKNDPCYWGQKNDLVQDKVLRPAMVREYDWSGTVVFASVCYSAAQTKENRAIPSAFLDKGAVAFIGSIGPSYGRLRPTLFQLDDKGDLLAREFIKAYRYEKDPQLALLISKAFFVVKSLPLDDKDKATLKDFVCLTRSENE